MAKIVNKLDEMTLFYNFLLDKVTSCTEVSKKLGIVQKNLTRYKRKFQKDGKLAVVNKLKCPVTNREVQFITTDPNRFPKTKQLNLFGHE